MSEEQANYYIPHARITQNARGVWVMRQEEYGGSGYTGALIGPDVLFPERENITLISGVKGNEIVGREMMLVPKGEVQDALSDALCRIAAECKQEYEWAVPDTLESMRFKIAWESATKAADALSGKRDTIIRNSMQHSRRNSDAFTEWCKATGREEKSHKQPITLTSTTHSS